jgi:hypothetical protein
MCLSTKSGDLNDYGWNSEIHKFSLDPIDPKNNTIPSVQFLLESLCVPWPTQLH